MKLHIGGDQIKDGWKILNSQEIEGVDYIGDIGDLNNFENDSIDEVYASHVLEHVPQHNIQKTLTEISRVLKPNGIFYVSVPDMDILAHMLLIRRTAQE